MNLREGTRRLALLLGALGAILGGFVSYLELDSVMAQRASHNRFERLVNSDVVQRERKNLADWVSIDPKTGERTEWEQQINKGGIKSISWSKDNNVESIETEDGQYLFPTPAPSVWEYLSIPLFPLLGFIIPWGVVRAIGWVVTGFMKGSS